MDSTLKEKYEIWMEKAVADPDLKPELEAMAGDEAKIEDALRTRFIRIWSLARRASGASSGPAPTA